LGLNRGDARGNSRERGGLSLAKRLKGKIWKRGHTLTSRERRKLLTHTTGDGKALNRPHGLGEFSLVRKYLSD